MISDRQFRGILMLPPDAIAQVLSAHSAPFLDEPVVLLVSPDSELITALQATFERLSLRLEVALDPETAIDAFGSLPKSAVILLDGRLPGMMHGGLLAAMYVAGVHKRYPIALIAEQVSDEWIARLREGSIDDIVSRDSDATTWRTRINTMQRGHELYRQVEHLRETAVIDLEHDAVTGVLNREAMLSILFRETDRVQRMRGALGLVLFEVDDLGHWRKQLGRESCDTLLAGIAERTGRILRSYDMFGRMGRNEFLIALPGCGMLNSVMLAERMRVEVFGEPFPTKHRDGEAIQARLSASFGVTTSRGRSPVVVLREAEETLAQGRLVGPDAIRCAGEVPLSFNSEEAAKLFTDSRLLAW